MIAGIEEFPAKQEEQPFVAKKMDATLLPSWKL